MLVHSCISHHAGVGTTITRLSARRRLACPNERERHIEVRLLESRIRKLTTPLSCKKQGGVGVAVEPLRHGMLTSAVSCSSKLCISARVFDSCTLSAVGSVSSVLTCQQMNESP